MPFTVSHVAAVLPAHRWLRRHGLFAAAAIGAMSPDLGFLLQLEFSREQTHGRWALLTFCLPTGLALWGLFQWLVRPALAEIVPDGMYLRLRAEHPPVQLARMRVWALAALLILAGAVTHLVWDGFTHEDGHGVRMFPTLENSEVSLGGRDLRLYRVFQHGSSIVGLAIVGFALWRWVRATPKSPAPLARRLGSAERWAWAAAYVMPAALLVLLVLAHVAQHGLHRLSADRLAWLAIALMYAAALALLVISVLLRLRLRVAGTESQN